MMYKILLRFGPAVFMSVLIFTLSSIPDLKISREFSVDVILRKIVHVGFFGMLFISYLWMLAGVGLQRGISILKSVENKKYLYAAILTAAFAVLDEFHQSFVPHRSGHLLDVLIDATGIALAIFILKSSIFSRSL